MLAQAQDTVRDQIWAEQCPWRPTCSGEGRAALSDTARTRTHSDVFIKNSKAHQTILRPLQFNKNCINFVSLVSIFPPKHCVYCAVSGLCIVMALLFVEKSSLIIIIRAPQSSVTCYTDSASSQRTNITAWWGHCTRGTWHNHTSME